LRVKEILEEEKAQLVYEIHSLRSQLENEKSEHEEAIEVIASMKQQIEDL
jgi:hypothetical protein